MTTSNASGAYHTCPFPSGTSQQCSLSTGSPLKTSVSYCCRSISFPHDDVPEHISVLSTVLSSPSIPVFLSSVPMVHDAFSPFWFTPAVVTLLPVSALSSNRSPATVSFMSSTICLSSATYLTFQYPLLRIFFYCIQASRPYARKYIAMLDQYRGVQLNSLRERDTLCEA